MARSSVLPGGDTKPRRDLPDRRDEEAVDPLREPRGLRGEAHARGKGELTTEVHRGARSLLASTRRDDMLTASRISARLGTPIVPSLSRSRTRAAPWRPSCSISGRPPPSAPSSLQRTKTPSVARRTPSRPAAIEAYRNAGPRRRPSSVAQVVPAAACSTAPTFGWSSRSRYDAEILSARRRAPTCSSVRACGS